VLPQAHAAGLVAAVVSQSYGLRSVLLRWFTPEGFFDAVARYGVTSTALVPAMMVMLLEHPDADRYDLSTLEEVAVGAAPCPIELVQSFQQRFGVRAREVYGLTEAAAVVTANRRSLPVKPGSAGPPIPGVEVRIVDEDGRRLPAGECGEITVRGETVMAGYWNRPDATAEAIRDGWLYTGDVGYLDEDGYLYLVDRAKDLIIRGGQNIYPRDVEEVLQQHPAVAEAAVIGLPDSKYGEEVAACVVAREGTEVAPEEIVAFCRERLARYKTPKSVHLMPALPHNAVGKVLKGELRQKLAASPPAAPSPRSPPGSASPPPAASSSSAIKPRSASP
jgi:long-chain acyl-CoA synthetase